jgi:formylmethanofuran dehydrogenase subunit B
VLAHALLELARAATRTTRCSLLMLGGSANLLGVNQVCTRQSGYPLRTSFAGGAPEHDPWRYSARRMLASGEADALVWISAFDATRVPPATDAPTILMTPPGAPLTTRAAVHVPVGVPGIDHAGQIFRTDGIVAVPLRALRAGTLPDVAAVLGLIDSRLAARGSAP